MTLEIDHFLPDGVLTNGAGREFASGLADTATWLSGQEPFLKKTGESVDWISQNGNASAQPVSPNLGNATIGQDGHARGLRCQSEVNCGFVLDKVTADASRFSMAVIYIPSESGDARTLLSLNTGFERNKKGSYLFLSDADGKLTAKDTGGHVEIEQSVPPVVGKPRLVIVSLDGNRLSLFSSDRGAEFTEAVAPKMNKSADLFIGCRSHRSGLKKTLGNALIRDVLFWPRHLLLLPRSSEDKAQLSALQNYFFWTD